MPASVPHSEAELLDAFGRYQRGILGFVESTVQNHRSYLTNYFSWWHRTHPSNQSPVGARPLDVTAFLIAESERGMGPRTRKSELGAVRALYSWLVLTEQVTHNPAVLVPSPRTDPPANEIYTPEQTAAILAYTGGLTDVAGRQRHAIVATLRYTGMRSGELRHLLLDDLDLTAGQAQVIGKQKRPRVVLLPPRLMGILEEFLSEVRPQLPSSPLLLANPNRLVTTPHRGFGSEPLHREVRTAGRGAQVPGRHFPHKWRHTYATELVRAGLDIHLVQRLLGHISIASTVGYAHLGVEDLRRAITPLWQRRDGDESLPPPAC